MWKQSQRSLDLQDDWAVVLEDLHHFCFSIVIVRLRLKSERSDTLPVINSSCLVFAGKASVIFFIVVESDHYLPFRFVLRNSPVSRASIAFIIMLGIFPQFLDSLSEDKRVISGLLELDHEFSPLFLHELARVRLLIDVGLLDFIRPNESSEFIVTFEETRIISCN